MNRKPRLVVELSSQAGSCLTSQNWQELGINAAAYSLASLLVKPGLACLQALPNLASYLAWPGYLVLDASMLTVVKNERYIIRSPYDGQCEEYTPQQILSLIATLQPHAVLLPPDFCRHEASLWSCLPDHILLFFKDHALPSSEPRQYGCYGAEAVYESPRPNYRLCTQRDSLLNASMRCDFIQANHPAEDGSQGILYASTGIFAIQAPAEALQFSVIEPHCACPTCQQQLTRAYLHHLFQHTPLLCQRLLIQHNVYFTKQKYLPELEISL